MKQNTQKEHMNTLPDSVDAQNPVIEISHLKKSFGHLEVLKDISFNLLPGENLVVLGKSGSGKSVLIKCIVGLLKADSGIIKVFGQDISDPDNKVLVQLREKIGFLFQSGALFDSMTVRQNLEFPLRKTKKDLTEKEKENKIHEALENVGLPDVIDKMPSELSGGMRKRISLARTLVMSPGIMLYDEPTTGLDPVTSEEISELINGVRKKYNTSSIIITHDIKCAMIIADRMIMLQEGNIYKEGNPELFKNSDDEFIQSFFK
ncbi:MAG: ATP-binding cassette domain-containing protein [Saprospiraceae bacterium]|nr:ATP-binding cassette domain-containing protein [Saprospiraceae bacterium]